MAGDGVPHIVVENRHRALSGSTAQRNRNAPPGSLPLRVMAFKLIALCLTLLSLKAQELASVEVYTVAEITFSGSPQPPVRSPARDTDFWLRIWHESGSP